MRTHGGFIVLPPHWKTELPTITQYISQSQSSDIEQTSSYLILLIQSVKLSASILYDIGLTQLEFEPMLSRMINLPALLTIQLSCLVMSWGNVLVNKHIDLVILPTASMLGFL